MAHFSVYPELSQGKVFRFSYILYISGWKHCALQTLPAMKLDLLLREHETNGGIASY